MPNKKLQQAVMERALRQMLSESSVPYKHHVKVVEALHKAFSDHAGDRQLYNTAIRKALAQVEQYGKGFGAMEDVLAKYRAEVKRLTNIERLKGQDGNDGVAPTVADIVPEVLKRMPTPKEVSPPVPIDVIVRAVLDKIPQPKDGKSVEMDKLVEAVIKELQKGDRLHISHVKGAGGFIKDGIKYRFEELMHGAGRGSGGSNIATEQLTATQSGTDVTLNLALLAHTFSVVQFVTRNGQILLPNGSAAFPGSSWSRSGNTVTVYNADAGDIYMTQYLYA